MILFKKWARYKVMYIWWILNVFIYHHQLCVPCIIFTFYLQGLFNWHHTSWFYYCWYSLWIKMSSCWIDTVFYSFFPLCSCHFAFCIFFLIIVCVIAALYLLLLFNYYCYYLLIYLLIYLFIYIISSIYLFLSLSLYIYICIYICGLDLYKVYLLSPLPTKDLLHFILHIFKVL